MSGLAEFSAFDLLHPDVWEHFVERAEQLLARGVEHYSADAILHVVRFHRLTSVTGAKPFAINNNFSAFYARKWRETRPEHAEFFEYRASVADREAVA